MPDAAVLVVPEGDTGLHRGAQSALDRGEVRHVLLEDGGQPAEFGDVRPPVIEAKYLRLRGWRSFTLRKGRKEHDVQDRRLWVVPIGPEAVVDLTEAPPRHEVGEHEILNGV